MEIQPKYHPLPGIMGDHHAVASGGKTRTDVVRELDFGSTHSLENALAETPDIRPEKVERGKILAGSIDYPPEETMAKIARLFALNI